MSRGWLIGGVIAVVVTVGVVVALVVSGGDSASSESIAPTPGGLPGALSDDQQPELEEFQDCLGDHGVELPEPGTGPAATQQPDSEMLGALEECEQYAPEGFGPGGPPIQGQ